MPSARPRGTGVILARMKRDPWRIVFVVFGVGLMTATLFAQRWAVDVHGDYRWGLRSQEYCGAPCYTHGIDAVYGSFETLGMAAFLMTIASAIIAVVALAKDRSKELAAVATAVILLATLAAIAFVANQPISAHLGWPLPAYLFGAVMAIGTMRATRPKASAEL